MFDELSVFVYFVYGLSFFGMGLTLALESERHPSLVEAHLLRPLAAFGMIHGTHEWLESYLIQSEIGGLVLPDWLPWVRLVMLASSFFALLYYGIFSLKEYPFQPPWLFWGTIGILTLFFAGIVFSAIHSYGLKNIPWKEILDGLIRYTVAIPGAALAALALRAEALWLEKDGHSKLRVFLSVASLGFILYTLSQVFVPKMVMFPGNLLNAVAFREEVGFPVQVLRTLAAVTITISMLRATQVVEKRRQQEVLSIQNARLEALEHIQEETRNREIMRRELLRHIVEAQEDERARIARELHDETSQTLAAFSLDVATLQTAVMDKPDLLLITNRLQSLGKMMSQGLYRLVHDLRPAHLDDLGLDSAIRFLVEDNFRFKGMDIRVEIQGTPRRLEPVVETVLFRVAQEALNNVLRHAQADHVEVQIKYGVREITLIITDNGIGFEPKESFSPPRGWGLNGMRERVEAVGGQLFIRSAPGKGTTIEAEIDVFDIIP